MVSFHELDVSSIGSFIFRLVDWYSSEKRCLINCGKDIALGSPPASGECWQQAIFLIEQLIESGLPPSDRELREMILPLGDVLPEATEITPGFDRDLCEVDRHLSEVAAPVVVQSTEPTVEIETVAELLLGRTIVPADDDGSPFDCSIV